MTPTPDDRLPRPRLVIDAYAESLGGGRAILHRDVIVDGELIAELTGTIGSPAPIATVRAAADAMTRSVR